MARFETMTGLPIDRTLAAFADCDIQSAGERRWKCRCPAHDDRSPSLSISVGDGGTVLVKCFVGCATKDVLAAVGMEMKELFVQQAEQTARSKPSTQAPPKKGYQSGQEALADYGHGQPTRTFRYTDRAGNVVAAIGRWDPGFRAGERKTFRPVAKCSDGLWRKQDPASKWPLYRLAKLDVGIVAVFEGEGKTDTAAELGIIGVTSAHGAQSAAKTDWSPLAGRDVIVFPDAGKPGERYAADVCRILLALPTPARVRIVRLPGLADGDDIVEFLASRRANGKTDGDILVEIDQLAQAAPYETDRPESSPQQADSSPPPAPATHGPRQTTLLDAARFYLDSIRDGQSPLIELGIPDLDYAIGGGVERGEFIILAARPSHGKSAVALQIVHHLTAQGMPCVIISEEMSEVALGKRTVQFVSDMPQEHWPDLTAHLDATIDGYAETHAKAIVFEGCGEAATAVEAIEAAIETEKIGCVVVDYAQLLRGQGRTRYEQLTAVSMTLRNLASKHKIIVIALCQLSRDIEQRAEFRPCMSDIKESGQFEQDADVIVFLVWPWLINQSEPQARYQFFIEKNRNRAINQRAVDCSFNPVRQMVSMPSIESDFERRGRGSELPR